MLKLENLITVKQYAHLCDIQHIAVYRRIKKHIITAVTVGGVKFIDVERHPPVKRNPYRQRSKEVPFYDLTAATDEKGQGVILAHLITAEQYAGKVGIKPATVYKKIILKQMEALIIGDVIFIDSEKYPPSQYVLSRKPSRKSWEMR